MVEPTLMRRQHGVERLAWRTVAREPSRMKPLRQSGAAMRSAIMAISTSSGTSCPASMIGLALRPISVPAATALRSNVAGRQLDQPVFSSIRFAACPCPRPVARAG